VLPLSIATEARAKVLRIAMADPTDAPAIAELEQITRCEIELTALPLSAIEELVEKGYRQINTAVTPRPTGTTGKLLAARKTAPVETQSETSVTAQIPLSALRDVIPADVETRLSVLVEILIAKGLITEDELTEALKKRGV
jgi:hypothetical protein